MKTRNRKLVWVVVQVQSGIPVLAEVFQDKAKAERRERALIRESREEYDAVDVFESRLAHAPR